MTEVTNKFRQHFHDVKIKAGYNKKPQLIEIDGEIFDGVKSLQINYAVDKITTMTIEFYCDNIEIEGTMQVADGDDTA